MMTQVERELSVVKNNDLCDGFCVAFASSDRRTVDQHFGSTKALAIYCISAERSQLLSIAEFGDIHQDGDDGKLIAKLERLEGCIAVYCRACGAAAIQHLLALGVQPVRVDEGTRIALLLNDLRQQLRDTPHGWLKTALKRQQQQANPQRFFDLADDENWQE